MPNGVAVLVNYFDSYSGSSPQTAHTMVVNLPRHTGIQGFDAIRTQYNHPEIYQSKHFTQLTKTTANGSIRICNCTIQ